MLCDRFRYAMVDGKILAPAADHRSHPQDDAGQDGEESRARSKRMQCLIHMLGRLGRQVGFKEHALPQLVKSYCTDDDRDDITECCGQLRTGNIGDEGRDFDPACRSPVAPHYAGKGRGCHGGLLGREYQSENL